MGFAGDAAGVQTGFDNVGKTGNDLTNFAFAEISRDAFQKTSGIEFNQRFDTASAYLPGFDLFDSIHPLQVSEPSKPAESQQPAERSQTQVAEKPGSQPLSDKLEKSVDAIEDACNGGLTGIGTDESKLWNTLTNLNQKEFEQVNERFAAKYGAKYAMNGEKWDIHSELKDELNPLDLQRFERMIADKKVNEVPEQFRTDGQSLLKEGGGLKVAEMNTVNLPDGRSYDVYVPRNADSRAPVMIAMFGAAAGDAKGAMAAETGLQIEAEKTGSIIVFPNAKLREFKGAMGSGVAWNVPGHQNLTNDVDNSYDDRNYLDNVVADLGQRSKIAEKVGLMGFSDGARFAQVYAADRADKVAGVVSMSGTWIEGESKPKEAVPMMIVHGDRDKTLPYDGGTGIMTKGIAKMMDTNLEKSQPFMQSKVWSEAAGGDGTITLRVDHETFEERNYSAKNGEVKEYIVKAAGHAIHDYKNNGWRGVQLILGQPQLNHDFVTKGAGFLKAHIVRSLESGTSK
jgi:poly(3-hydroxybutyrate) depolymerase